MNVLEEMKIVFDVSKNSKLNAKIFVTLDKELTSLSKRFACSKVKSFFIANVFYKGIEDTWVFIRDLTYHFDCEISKLVQYNDELIALMKSDYFDVEDYGFLNIILNTDVKFRCADEIVISAINNEDLKFETTKKALNKYSFLVEISDLFSKENPFRHGDNKTINKGERFKGKEIKNKHEAIQQIIKKYESYELTKFFKINNFDTESIALFSYILWAKLTSAQQVDSTSLANKMFDDRATSVALSQKLLSGEHFLIKNKWLNLTDEQYARIGIVISISAIKAMAKTGFVIYDENKPVIKTIHSFED